MKQWIVDLLGKIDVILEALVYGDKPPTPTMPQNELQTNQPGYVASLQAAQATQPTTATPVPSVKPSETPVPGLLTAFCQSIAIYEGGTEAGTRPYRNCNPGDLRWPYGKPFPYGATDVDSGNFLIFPTYADGFNALVTMVTRCAKGYSKVYSPTMTIVQFFQTYAPSEDNNDPNRYAEWVAQRCGISGDDLIKSLIS